MNGSHLEMVVAWIFIIVPLAIIARAAVLEDRERRRIIADIRSRPIVFSCYKCGEPISAPRYYLGTEIVCGDCYMRNFDR